MNSIISIITISYNAASRIEKTILSVLNQTYKNIEYIIIDGGSTDGTVDIIKKYSNNISFWISEPDKGIYDAMNKGIIKASGEYIQFINAGDVIYSNETIQNIIHKVPNTNNDVIYGDIAIEKTFGLYHFVPLELSDFQYRFPIYHPSTWVKSKILKEQQFDTDFKIAADFNFFRKIYFKKATFFYIPIIFTIFEGEEGVSSTNHKRLWQEQQMIIGSNKLNIKKYIFNFKYELKKIIKILIAKLKPNYLKERDINRFLKDSRIKGKIKLK